MDSAAPRIDRLGDIAMFVRVAERGNFSRAAHDMHVSPSTVSKLIDRLEHRLSVRLFDRTSRAVMLTDEGARFYERAIVLLRAAEEAEAAVCPGQGALQGVLRVHAMPAFARTLLAGWLAEFTARHAQLHVELFTGVASPSLTAQGLDLLIHSGELGDSTLVARRIFTVRWIVCAAPAYLERHGRPGSMAELRSHRCLNFLDRGEWNAWPQPVREGRLTAPGAGGISADDGGVLVELARAGAGIARLGDFHIRADIEKGTLVPLLLDAGFDTVPVYAAHHSRRNMPARLRALLAHLEAACTRYDADMRAWTQALYRQRDQAAGNCCLTSSTQ